MDIKKLHKTQLLNERKVMIKNAVLKTFTKELFF